PNAFEFEQLVGRELPTIDATIRAAREFLTGRNEWVVVTSAAPAQEERAARILVATRQGAEVVSWRPLVTAAKGTGDLFAAMAISELLRGAPLKDAVTAAHERVVRVLERTTRLNSNELVINEPR